jgi:hypothetical protein
MTDSLARAADPAAQQTAIRESLLQCKVVPWNQLSAAIDAVKDGASYRLAAKAAGLSKFVFDTMIELGAQGIKPWDEFFEVIERADAISQIPTMTKLKSQSEEGNSSARKEYMQIKAPEEWGSIIPDRSHSPAGLSLPGGINVQIAQFGQGASDAIKERQITGGSVIEHQGNGESRIPARCSGSGVSGQGGLVQEEKEGQEEK